MQDIASQVAQLESRIDALQSSQQTLTILFVIALIVIAVLIGMLIATRSQRPPARHAPPLPPRPEPRVPQAAPAAAEPPPEGGGRPQGRGMRGGGFGSVVDAGSVLLALTPASELIAFQPDGKAYSELARIKVGSSQTHAYPVASGNRLFVKDQDAVMLYTVQ